LFDTISAIILAGGRSSRMGTDKALLPLPDKPDITFVEHLASLLASTCHEVLLVARDPIQAADYAPVKSPNVRLLTDETPNIGPLMGLYSGLKAIPGGIHEAAAIDGAGRWATFWRVTFPLSLPGVIAAFVFVLIPTTGEFIAPLYVGGPRNQLFGNVIQSFFGDSPNWNYGAVLALALIAVVLVLMLVFGRFLNTDLRRQGAEVGP